MADTTDFFVIWALTAHGRDVTTVNAADPDPEDLTLDQGQWTSLADSLLGG